MEPNNQYPKIGIGVVIFKDGKILLGKRKNAYGDGDNVYACPGGHMEYMESIENCAKRETLEETGIEIENVKFLCLRNLKDYPPKHYINIGLRAEYKNGEPKNLEPDKCEGWDWYDLNNLPDNLYGTMDSYLEALRSGKNYFDA